MHTVRTAAELAEVLAGVDPATVLEWEYDGPQECCDGHMHDITLVVECDAQADPYGHRLTIRLSGGSV